MAGRLPVLLLLVLCTADKCRPLTCLCCSVQGCHAVCHIMTAHMARQGLQRGLSKAYSTYPQLSPLGPWAPHAHRLTKAVLIPKTCRQLSFGCWGHKTLQKPATGASAWAVAVAAHLTCGAPEVDQHSPVPQPSNQECKGQLPACGMSAVRPAVGAQNGRPWCSLLCRRVQQNGFHRETSSPLGGGFDLQCRDMLGRRCKALLSCIHPSLISPVSDECCCCSGEGSLACEDIRQQPDDRILWQPLEAAAGQKHLLTL